MPENARKALVQRTESRTAHLVAGEFVSIKFEFFFSLFSQFSPSSIL